ncbi:hypothetical protein Tco_0502322 [Tanacetum coccineum]
MEFRANYKTMLGKEIKGPEALDFIDFAWNRLFRIQEPVIREYVLEFLSIFKFKYHVMELDIVDTMVFQLGGVKRSMTMRQFILALGLYTEEEMKNNLFEFFRDACGHNVKENVTLEDLFFLHSMDGGAMVDVPWNIAKFLFDKAKGAKKKSMILVDDMLDKSEDEDAAAKARRAQDEADG